MNLINIRGKIVLKERELSDDVKKWLPKWLVADSLLPSSRDPLGLQANAERLANRLLPGLTVFTNRIGYFFFLSWALRELNKYKELNIGDRIDKLNRFERALVLCEALYHGKDHLKDCRHQGQRSKGHLFDQIEKTALIPDRILKNQNNTGCYNLYRTPMQSCGFWVNDDDAAAQGLIPFRLTDLGEKLANAFERRDGVRPLFKWALNGTGRKKVEDLKQWSESFCFSTFDKRSDKRIFLEGFLFAGGKLADIVGDADTRLQTLLTLVGAGLISEQSSSLSNNNVAIISEETAGADITEQDMDELGGDSFVLLMFYNNRLLKGGEPFIAAAIYEMLSLALNAIWSGLLDYVRDNGRTSLINWAEYAVSQNSGDPFWETPIRSSSSLIWKSEEQLVQDLFSGTNKIENGLMLVIKVLSINNNLEVLNNILGSTELYSEIKSEIFSKPDVQVRTLLPRIARILLVRHGNVSELKGKERWLDLDNDDVLMMDRQEMALGFHSYRIRQLESLIRDLNLNAGDLVHG